MATESLAMSIDEYEQQFPINQHNDKSLIIKKVFDAKNNQTHNYTINRSGQLHGLYRIYHGTNNLIMECNFSNGLKHGKMLEWNLANGILTREINFRYGLCHGSYKEYETSYITSEIDPEMVQHFLKVHCNYYMNRLHGPFIMKDIHDGKQVIHYYYYGKLCVTPKYIQ